MLEREQLNYILKYVCNQCVRLLHGSIVSVSYSLERDSFSPVSLDSLCIYIITDAPHVDILRFRRKIYQCCEYLEEKVSYGCTVRVYANEYCKYKDTVLDTTCRSDTVWFYDGSSLTVTNLT